jgi:hypothetical protein
MQFLQTMHGYIMGGKNEYHIQRAEKDNIKVVVD